jgi:MoaA/NifB/PqqE/SkfB family radical SAM enzyme
MLLWQCTSACNLECPHCSRLGASRWLPEGDLTTEQGLDLIRSLPQIGAPTLVFCGGEPLMLHPVACGVALPSSAMLDEMEYELALQWIRDKSKEHKIDLQTTCPPHYFRLKLQQEKEERRIKLLGTAPAKGHSIGHAAAVPSPVPQCCLGCRARALAQAYDCPAENNLASGR